MTSFKDLPIDQDFRFTTPTFQSVCRKIGPRTYVPDAGNTAKPLRVGSVKAEVIDLGPHDRLAASIRHHEARLSRAVAARDYSTMRDAQKALADLRAIQPRTA